MEAVNCISATVRMVLASRIELNKGSTAALTSSVIAIASTLGASTPTGRSGSSANEIAGRIVAARTIRAAHPVQATEAQNRERKRDTGKLLQNGMAIRSFIISGQARVVDKADLDRDLALFLLFAGLTSLRHLRETQIATECSVSTQPKTCLLAKDWQGNRS